MKTVRIYLCAVLSIIVIGGCSRESKEDYQQAGQSIKHAAAETGKGLKTDVKVAKEATVKATGAAKKTIEERSKSAKDQEAKH